MAKKTGLGKGLDALFSMPVEEKVEPVEANPVQNGVVKLNVNEIEPNVNQARKIFLNLEI